ncbi:uncharacterized protein LOC132720934 [Ruditapes philippinarum]|uniref:uncharacterized protein LOC132720934 n=1 Tax=Ruditapes philippinarum TaxID=129788 RepID=UPI00295B2765|nr:uncharacterized protein LOC132720934 [Ruditapes philippinarum]
MADHIVNICKTACDLHKTAERREFKMITQKMSFEDIEGMYLCHPGGISEVSISSSENGPWTALKEDNLYDVPVMEILEKFRGFTFFRIRCVATDQSDIATDKNSEVDTSKIGARNAFEILMQAEKNTPTLPKKRTTSSGVPVDKGISRKDELFNKVIDWMADRGLKFLDPDTEGLYIVQVLTNALWYITNQQTVINDRSRREVAVYSVPTAFEDFVGFNDHRRKKLKAQPLESNVLKSHAEALFSLCTRPLLRSSPQWEQAYQDIKDLASCLWSYHSYLDRKRHVSETYRNMDHPARPIAKYTSIYTVHKCTSEVKHTYKLLDKALNIADLYEPVFFDENIHLNLPFNDNMQRLRFFENVNLSVTVDIIKFCPGGSILTVYCFCKVPDTRTDAQKQTDAGSLLLKIRPQLPEYHTMFMKQQFKRRLGNVVSIQPGVVDMIYKELALDASATSHPDFQQRLRLIYMGETGLLPDLRKMNTGRPSDKFDVFFTKLGEIIEENTAADERRHNEAHMSQYLSVNDLVTQAADQCPPGSEIPSNALVRLQFMPKNPYSKTALAFTSKLPIQYKIQRRQLRLAHPDDHFTFALFKYLRSFAVKLGDSCTLFCCDDKAKVHIGEPGVALSTGVRGKKSIAPANTTLVATDHDMHHKGSLTPSVYLKCDVPKDMNGSFYRGKVTTVINDSVFQSSNPMRHAAVLARLVKNDPSCPKVFLRFTDGGTDHRNTLEHVKCASICLFKELDLDMFVACRCAPGQSFINPAERVMSILNIGLQNCTLSREKSEDAVEDVLKKCNSMDDLRKKGTDISDQWAQSIEPVRQKVMSRFLRLALKGEPIQVMDPVGDEEIDLLSKHLNYMFPNMNTEKLVKSETNKVKEYIVWLENHCRQRQYSFQIKKCGNPDCCSPATLDLSWLPEILY